MNPRVPHSPRFWTFLALVLGIVLAASPAEAQVDRAQVPPAKLQRVQNLQIQIQQGRLQLRRALPARAVQAADATDAGNDPAAPVPREPLERDGVEPEPAPNPANPLERIFRGIFQKPNQPILPRPVPGNPPPDTPADAASEAASEKESVYDRDIVDRCAPHNPALEKLLVKAQRYVENGNHKIAIELLQQILDQPGNDLVNVAPGRSELIRDVVNRALKSLPEEAQELYRIQYAGVAEQTWKEARAAGDPVAIADLATRYLLTPAGAEAAEYLVSLHVERGEWASASIWFGRLREFYPNAVRTPAWYLKAAVCYHRAGRAEEVRRILEQDLKGLETVQLAGRAVSPTEFVAALKARPDVGVPVVADWTMHRGTPRRSAVSPGEPPMLVPRWDFPLSYSKRVNDQIEELIDDLRDSGRAAIPISEPLVIGNRGVIRTLQGVAVVDLETGERLWQTRAFHSPERILTGVQLNDNNYSDGFVMINGGIIVQQYQGSSPESQPLTSLLFRDGIYGFVSSNGRHLYTIENHAWLSQFQPGNYYGNGAEENDQLRRSWNTNQLTAYDLATGQVVWEIGGEQLKEPFDLPLAGNYFLGAPLVDGDRLYVVGEEDNEVRLHCLDAVTGHPLWSQLIGYSLHSLDRDFGRRWWTAQPAIADGVVVCPNSNGWLVAVDATSHNILWEMRFRPPARNSNSRRAARGDQREGLVEMKSLNGDWRTTSPIIVDGKVYYTPKEHDVLQCLDLVSGKSLWSLARKNYIALVGVYGDRLLLLEEGRLVVIDTDDRDVVWEAKFDNPTHKLSGMPVVTETEVYLPSSAGELRRLSLTDGKLLGTQTLSTGQRPLGNLQFHGGRLISADAQGARAFDLETTYQAELAERRAANPDDAWSYLQESRRLLQTDDRSGSLELLRKVDPEALLPGDRDRFRAAMRDTLLELTTREPTARDDLFAELAAFVESDSDRIDYWKLRTTRSLAKGETQRAFDDLLQLETTEDLERLVDLGHKSHVRIRLRQWLSGAIATLLESAPVDERGELDAEIVRRAEALDVAASTGDALRFVHLFDGHPATIDVRARLARAFLEQNRFAEAEHQWLLLTESPDRAAAARAWIELVDQYHARGRTAALWDATQAARRRVGNESIDGRTLASILDEKQQAWDLREPPRQRLAQWGDFDLEVESSALNYQVMQQYQAKMNTRLNAALSDFRIDYNRNSQRLRITNRIDHDMLWSLPLRGNSYYSNREAGQIRSLGHLLVVQQAEGLTVLSPTEKRVVWSRSLNSGNAGRNYYRSYSNNSSSPGMVAKTNLVSTYGLIKEEREDTAAAIGPRYLCVQGQRDVQVFDTATGSLLWMLDKLPQGTTLVSGQDDLYVITPNVSDSRRIRFRDARSQNLGTVAGTLRSALHVDGDDAIVCETQTRTSLLLRTTSASLLRRINLLTGDEVWKTELTDNALLQKGESGLYSLDRSAGTLSFIDFATGKQRDVVQIESFRNDRSSTVYLVESSDRIYLIQNNAKSKPNSVYRNYQLEGVYAHGELHAIDRADGKLAWSRPVEAQFLLTDLLDDSPVLVFAARSQAQRGQVWISEQKTLIMDRQTGRELYNRKGAIANDVQALHINHDDRNILMVTYNQKLAFRAVERKPEAAPAEEKPGGEQTETAPATSSGTK